jgi:hypothetical protein
VGRLDRLILLLLVITLVAWRLARFMRLGMGKRRPSLGIAGGWFPTSNETAVAATTGSTVSNPKSPLLVRTVVALVIVAIWLIGNLLIWLFLLEPPLLRNVPPVVLGVTGIFANFYLIPFARHMGERCRRRFNGTRAAG